jgi:hypothetical protein
MIYGWNIAQWLKVILPPRLRVAIMPRLRDLFLSALDGVSTLHNTFMLFRESVLYRLKWTSQTIYLEKLLNERFNNDQPAFADFELRVNPVGIYITDPATYNEAIYRWNGVEQRHQARRYNRSELAAMSAYDPRKKYRYNQSELGANLDFVVMVPYTVFDVSDTANAVQLANMKAWINLYLIAGSRYDIQNY